VTKVRFKPKTNGNGTLENLNEA